MSTTMSLPKSNTLLASLTPEIQHAWFPRLKKVDLTVGAPIGRPGQVSEYVYFPVDCVIAVVNVMHDGSTVSTAMIGQEGMLGVDVFLGNGQASVTAVTQASGTAFRLPAADLAKAFNACSELRHTLLRYTLSLIRQMEQTSVCNRHHCIDQQLCRWILLSLDRLQTSTLTITQELISQLLGVRREGVSEAAVRLQRAGAIRYSRGKIQVLNRPLLEELSCGCYAKPAVPAPYSRGRAA